MTTSTKLSITDLAAIALAELHEPAERQGDEMFIQHRDEFLSSAWNKSESVLGKEASEQLTWEFTGTLNLPEGVEQATALIDEGPAYLRYRLAEGKFSFELVRPCSTCGHEQVDAVDSLVTLGGLLEHRQQKAA